MKRSGPPQRKTELKRGEWRRATPGAAAASLRTDARPRKPLKAVSTRRRKRDALYPQRRVEVFERAGGRCEARIHHDGCTGRCEQVHHLAGRGGPDPHRLENLLGVCGPCHHFIHVEPAAAMRAGLMVRRNGGGDA